MIDLNSQNATVDQSAIKLSYIYDGKKTNFNCVIKTDFFICRPLELVKLTSGQISIEATRSGFKGGTVVYELPLTLKAKTH